MLVLHVLRFWIGAQNKERARRAAAKEAGPRRLLQGECVGVGVFFFFFFFFFFFLLDVCQYVYDPSGAPNTRLRALLLFKRCGDR